MRDAREVRMSRVQEDVVFAALRHKGWNDQDGCAGLDEPMVAECAAARLVGSVPAGKIGCG